jgi:hypothetical protein
MPYKGITMSAKQLKYGVGPMREAGLEAKWTKTSAGAPIIVARKPGTETFFAVGNDMFEAMKSEGVLPAFERFTLLGDIFSVAI